METFIKNVNNKDAKKLINWWKFHNYIEYTLNKCKILYNYTFIPHTLKKNNKLGNIYREILESKNR
jgi:hypothetical protein